MALNACPVTGKLIPRRFAVHDSVLAESLKTGAVRENPQSGTLRKYVYAYGGGKRKG